ncbi:MAG: DEAD/DEAH box helicase [Candidatus Njordarchaeota archaeon]
MKHVDLSTLLEYGVKEEIVNTLKNRGILSLRPFQFDAIRIGLNKKSLLVVAPTGSGKTLIAEIIAVNRIINEGIKAFYLTPYKALAEEIANTFRDRYPIRVGVATGDYRDKPIRSLREYDLLVLTYEKADHILREQPEWLKSMNISIVDEIHLLGDPHRGPLLDIVLTYLKNRRCQIVGLSATIMNPEHISMWLQAELIKSDYRPVKLLECVYLIPESKLIIFDPRPSEKEQYMISDSNVHVTTQTSGPIDKFLDKKKSPKKDDLLKKILGEKYEIIQIKEGKARIVERTFQHDNLCVELEKKYRNYINGGKFYVKPIRCASQSRSRSFINAILDIIYDTLIEMQEYEQCWQVLIFRSSRSLTQKTAKRIAEFMKTHKLLDLFPYSALVSKDLEQKIDDHTLLTKDLILCTKYSVGFHHAGLSREERNIIENAFRERKIAVLVATPTLAAGVNLPARRVIIEEKYYEPEYGGRVDLSTSDYKQRGGRAGRPGYDKVGETILIAKDRNNLHKFIKKYILGKPEEIKPISGHIPPVVYSQILALISIKKQLTYDEIIKFFYETFFAHYCKINNDSYGMYILSRNIQDGLDFLLDTDLIRLSNRGSKQTYLATSLGRTLVRLYLKPTSAKPIIDTIKEWLKKRKKWTKQKKLEILFAIASSPESLKIIKKLLSRFANLINFVINHTDVLKNLSHIIPIDDLISSISLGREYLTANDEELLSILGGVSIIQDWIQGKPISKILDPFLPNFGPGDLNEFIRISTWLTYCASEISSVLGLPPNIIEKLKTLSKMIRYGVSEDLLRIVEEVEGIGRTRAIALKKVGFDTFEKIARADIESLKRVAGIGDVLAKRLKQIAKKKNPQNL